MNQMFKKPMMTRVKLSLQSAIAVLLVITLAAPAWAFTGPSRNSEINLNTLGERHHAGIWHL